MEKLDIPPAVSVSSNTHILPGALAVTEITFQVPLNYADPSAANITLFARLVNRHERHVVVPDKPASSKPFLVYFEGGPGFGNPEPQDYALTRTALAKGYQFLLLDYRGTGLSTPVSAAMLRQVAGESPDAQAAYLRLMRSDNIVRDCEAVRKALTKDWPEHRRKWSIFGHSFGGFVSLSYLSMHPEGLREAFLTGGLAPVGKKVDDVYAKTFAKTLQRNEKYYAKFPEDVATVRQIASFIESQGGSVPLPAGGSLTVPRFLTIGHSFGAHGGFDNVHSLLLRLKASLDQFGFFTRSALHSVEGWTGFDENIIYAVLHESIYCDGPGSASNWSAQRVGETLEPFGWLSPKNRLSSLLSSEKPLYFSGEMIFPFFFQTYPELQLLRDVAEKLASFEEWPALYDQEQLQKNEVPVYAASYVEDMYVDYDFAKNTAALCKNTKTFETNVMYHNAIRAKHEEVMQQLFALRDDTID